MPVKIVEDLNAGVILDERKKCKKTSNTKETNKKTEDKKDKE